MDRRERRTIFFIKHKSCLKIFPTTTFAFYFRESSQAELTFKLPAKWIVDREIE